MTDSSSFTSLLALVDSHLSKCSVQEGEGNGQTPFPMPFVMPSLHGNGQMGTFSESQLPTLRQRLPIPTLSTSESPITSILAEQLSNMFKAKELKKQQEEEKQRLSEEMRKLKLEEENCLIDLMPAIRKPSDLIPLPVHNEELSNSSSLESLLFDRQDFYDDIDEKDMKQKPNPVLLPCKTDMSYILQEKIKMGKCSAFGKVLTARLRPVAAPYLREKVDESGVIRFDFSIKSPDDLVKEKLRRRTCSIVKQVDLVAEFLAANCD